MFSRSIGSSLFSVDGKWTSVTATVWEGMVTRDSALREDGLCCSQGKSRGAAELLAGGEWTFDFSLLLSISHSPRKEIMSIRHGLEISYN